MTVQTLKEMLSLTEFDLPDPDRPVTGGYAGDLLSWVMGRAREGDCWITIMSNQNVAAVAVLAEVGCVLLAEGVQPPTRPCGAGPGGEGRQPAGHRPAHLCRRLRLGPVTWTLAGHARL